MTEWCGPLTSPPLPSQDLREKNWKAMEAVASAERACEEKLRSLTQAKVRVLAILRLASWNSSTEPTRCTSCVGDSLGLSVS